MANLSKLVEIQDLRQVWPHEAQDFTPWLAQDENIALLGDTIGLDITVEETESSVGGFSVDIYASENGTERKIIIENQLEDTNHDHLGKLITYASGKSADVLIWIVKKAREEHRAAIEWLNNHTDERIGFFLCEVKLYRIGNSDPAVKFEIIEKPNDWAKEIKQNESISETEQSRSEYWNAFQDYAFSKRQFSALFKRRKSWPCVWLDFSIGNSACYIRIWQNRRDNILTVGLYITNDKELFNKLYLNRTEIEKESGIVFDWKELPDKKASRIDIQNAVDFDNKSQYHSQFEWMMDMMLRIRNIFTKHIH